MPAKPLLAQKSFALPRNFLSTGRPASWPGKASRFCNTVQDGAQTPGGKDSLEPSPFFAGDDLGVAFAFAFSERLFKSSRSAAATHHRSLISPARGRPPGGSGTSDRDATIVSSVLESCCPVPAAEKASSAKAAPLLRFDVLEHGVLAASNLRASQHRRCHLRPRPAAAQDFKTPRLVGLGASAHTTSP